MNKEIKKDLYRYIGEDCNKNSSVNYDISCSLRVFQYIYFFRKAAAASKLTRLFWLIGLRFCMFKTGIQIPYTTKNRPRIQNSTFWQHCR